MHGLISLLPTRRQRIATFIGLALLLQLAACDLFALKQESDVLDGNWASTVAASAGKCCNLTLVLSSEDREVTGEGTVQTPGEGTGDVDTFNIRLKGTLIEDRIRLEFVSDFNPGTIIGAIDRAYPDQEIVLRVDFEGFGHSGQDIILFPRNN